MVADRRGRCKVWKPFATKALPDVEELADDLLGTEAGGLAGSASSITNSKEATPESSVDSVCLSSPFANTC